MRLIAEELAGIGISATYITKNNHQTETLYNYERINGVEVITIGRKHFYLRLVNWYTRLSGKSINYFHWATGRLLKKVRPDIVYTYYLHNECVYFLENRDSLGYKFVLRVAGQLWFEQIQRDPSLQKRYQFIFNKLDAFNFLTKQNKQLFLDSVKKLGMNAEVQEKDVILDIGIRTKTGNSSQWSLPQKMPFRMVMASRFADYAKRQDLLIEAVSLLPDKYNVRLDLPGYGEKAKYYSDLIDKKSLGNRISILPFMQQEELWQYIQDCHLLCHACNHEGLSKIILESMGIGTPVLVSDVIPLSEYITDHENGFLAKNTPEGWAEKIKYLYDNPSLLEKTSAEGKKYIEQHYDSGKRVQDYAAFFNTLAGPN